MSNGFIGFNRTLDSDLQAIDDLNKMSMEPVELIISRVAFALLVSISLVTNLLLLVAVIRRRQTVHVIYCFAAAMIFPDLVFVVCLKNVQSL